MSMWWLLGFTLAIRQTYLITKISAYNKALLRHGYSFAKLLVSILLAVLFWVVAFTIFTITLIKIAHYFKINYQSDMREIHYLISVLSIFFLITRTLFITPLIFKDDQGPLQALKKSWILTKQSSLKLIILIIGTLGIINGGIKLRYVAQDSAIKLLISAALLMIGIFLILFWLVIHKQISNHFYNRVQNNQNQT